MKINLLYFLLLLSFNGLTQRPISSEDSLLSLLKNAKEDSAKVDLLFNLSEICEVQDVLRYSELSYNLAKKLGYKKGIANAQVNMAYAYNAKGNPFMALQLYKYSLKLQSELGNEVAIANCLNSIGEVYKNLGEMKKALEEYQKALLLQQKIGNQKDIAVSYNNIGAIYFNQKNFPVALDYYKKALLISEKSNEMMNTAFSLGNISLVYLEQKNYPRALYCNLKSMDILKKLGDQIGIARSLNNIAAVYQSTNNRQKALECFKQSLAITEKSNFMQGTVLTLTGISTLYREDKDYKIALEYGERAHNLSLESSSPLNLEKTSENLFEIYRALGRNEEALKMHILYKESSDKINDQESQKASIQMIFNQKEEQFKKDQEKKDILAYAEKQKQKTVLISVSIFLFILLLFTIILFNRFKITQKQKRIIQEKNKEILDSINYAKRIQMALLPSEKYIEKSMNNFKNK